MEKRKVTKQIPHACPVCKGRGEIGPELAQHGAESKHSGHPVFSCHVCSGSCLIWEIREEDEDVVPTPIQLPPSIFTPNMPSIGLPQPYTVGDIPSYGGTSWTTNRPPELGKSDIIATN